MEQYYRGLFILWLIILAVIILIYVIRSIIGPKLTDRIIAVNAIGTLTIVAIAILAMLLKESYLLDVCLIYAMLSFLAVVVLVQLYLKVYAEKQKEDEEEHDWGEN